MKNLIKDWLLFLMPRLHLPRAPYNLFVYDFPYVFSGIVGNCGLPHICFHFKQPLCDFFDRFLQETGTKP